MNTFFFTKLIGEESDQLPPGSPLSVARASHARVQRWTARVEIFEKDYIVVPINHNLHWTLAVIVHPGVAGSAPPPVIAGDGAVTNLDSPAPMDVSLAPDGNARWAVVVHFDSFGKNHLNAECALRCWLAAEWAARGRGRALDDGLRRFAPESVPYLRPHVPQQPNLYDCGNFALEFARRFCLSAPDIFTREGYPYFMTPQWFRADEAGAIKRNHIHRSILSLAGLVPPPPPLPLACVQLALPAAASLPEAAMPARVSGVVAEPAATPITEPPSAPTRKVRRSHAEVQAERQRKVAEEEQHLADAAARGARERAIATRLAATLASKQLQDHLDAVRARVSTDTPAHPLSHSNSNSNSNSN